MGREYLERRDHFESRMSGENKARGVRGACSVSECVRYSVVVGR